MRICGDEFHPDGLSHEDMKQIAKYYSDTGMLDFIGVVGSGCDTHNTLANVIPNMTFPPEPFLHLAAGIRKWSTCRCYTRRTSRTRTRPRASSKAATWTWSA